MQRRRRTERRRMRAVWRLLGGDCYVRRSGTKATKDTKTTEQQDLHFAGSTISSTRLSSGSQRAAIAVTSAGASAR